MYTLYVLSLEGSLKKSSGGVDFVYNSTLVFYE